MDRIVVFRGFNSHPWLHKAFRRLKPDEVAICETFIITNKALDKGAFELKVNRMFLDKPKPKNFTIILELLTCCNS